MYVRSNLVEGEGVEFGQDCTAHDRKGQSIMMIVLLLSLIVHLTQTMDITLYTIFTVLFDHEL